jgi:ectoine hydroxylase-related dioxygenase (phytanoyl-CoA dioxygenase family)
MLSQEKLAYYRENGFMVLEGLLGDALTKKLSDVTDDYIARARGKTKSDHIHDLEDTHTPDNPRVRRLKDPCDLDPFYMDIARHPKIIEAATALIGPNIRLHHSKINIKAAGYGAAVEWHQDWAFYPATNDDIFEIGVAIDPLTLENGPLLAIPGSHKGPVYDHHVDGRFCGAIDVEAAGIDLSKALPLIGPAGSVTFHHVRTLHGSGLNRSKLSRRLLLIGYTAADAWPLMGVTDYDKYCKNLIAGKETIVPRMADVPVRMPMPPALSQGSIYENQKALKKRVYETVAN